MVSSPAGTMGVFMQEMTLDEYEAMMAEKNPKANKDAPKAQVNTSHVGSAVMLSLHTIQLSQVSATELFTHVHRTWKPDVIAY